MRIIVRTNRNEDNTPFLKKIMEKYKPEKSYIIFADGTGKGEFNGYSVECTQSYDDIRVIKNDYDGMPYCEDRIPIDKNLLKDFAPFLNNTLKMVERLDKHYFNHNNYLDTLEYIYDTISYWNTIIEKEKIDLYIHSYVPHLAYDYIIYALCKIKNIEVVFTGVSMLVGRYHIMNDVNEPCENFEGELEKVAIECKDKSLDEIDLEKDLDALFKKYTGDTSDWTPYYMQGINKEIEKNIPLEKPSAVVRFKNLLFKDGFFNSISRILKNGAKNGFINSIKDYFKGHKDYKAQLTFKNEYEQSWNSRVSQIDLSKKFIYMPLHMQPECTTLPLADEYESQELIIALLSSVVPDDVYLYVKENPKQTYRSRSQNFASRIAAMRNVKLVGKKFDTYKLLDNCLAVACANGTALLEGIFKGKQGIMFGNFILKYAPYINYVENENDIKHIINKVLAPKKVDDEYLKNIKIYFKAIQNTSFYSIMSHEPTIWENRDIDSAKITVEAYFNKIDELILSGKVSK